MIKWAMLDSIETASYLLNDQNPPQSITNKYRNPLFDLSKAYKEREFFEILHPRNMILTDDIKNDNNLSYNYDDVLFYGYDFDFIEPLLSLHSSLLSILPSNPKRKIKQDQNPIIFSPPLISHLYVCANLARKADRLSVAHGILKHAQKFIDRNKKKRINLKIDMRFNQDILMEHCIKLEEARYLKCEEYTSRAIEIGEYICSQMPRSNYRIQEKSYENQQVRLECDCDIGEWMMLSHLRVWRI